uniref:Putative secreted protein n=1 Tax=Ixodes ricinus TaxID=34613 RepID=A0A6B0UBI5_IXORI
MTRATFATTRWPWAIWASWRACSPALGGLPRWTCCRRPCTHRAPTTGTRMSTPTPTWEATFSDRAGSRKPSGRGQMPRTSYASSTMGVRTKRSTRSSWR